jgi:hypothetical protein
MGKPKEVHEKAIVEVIKTNKVMFIDHIFAYYTDLRQSQFYNLELDKSENIKDAISQNRLKGKTYMLNKWIASDQPTLQIAGFRLLADAEEHRKLNQQYIEQTTRLLPTTEEDCKKELQKIAEAEGVTLEELMEREGIA